MGVMQKGAMIQKLNKTYRDFWLLITTLTDGKAKNLSRQDLNVSDAPGSLGKSILRVQSTRPFEINGLTARRRNSSQTDYDVAIEFLQDVNFDEERSCFNVIKSNVRLLYMENYRKVKIQFQKDQTSGKVYSGVHFDFASQGTHTVDEYDHPVFHANFDLNCIEPSRLNRLNYEKPAVSRIDVPRIPTAPMDLAGVVFSVLRDHLPEKVVKGWPPKISTITENFPRYPRVTLDSCLKTDVKLSNTDWYHLNGQRN